MVNKLCRCYGWCNNEGKDKNILLDINKYLIFVEYAIIKCDGIVTYKNIFV